MELGFADSRQLIEKKRQNINDSCHNYERSPTGHGRASESQPP
jgi:hypothetical protein